MKKLALLFRRLEVTDPLVVKIVHNDLGVIPTWTIDANGIYRATFPIPIGFTPKQVTVIHNDDFQYIVAEGNGQSEIVFNAMLDDSTPLDAELSDVLVVLNVLTNVEATAAAPLS